MNPLDRKLTSVLKTLLTGAAEGAKRDKANKDFRDLRSRVVDSDLGRILDQLFGSFSAPAGRAKPDVGEVFKIIMALRERGFVEAPAFLFFQWRDVMGGQTLDEVLLVVPDAASMEVWRKSAQITAKEIEGRLLSDPVSTYATAGADWLLLHAKPRQLSALLELFLNRKERPKTLLPWADALVPALKKDKKGVLLERLLRHPRLDRGQCATFAEVVRLNRTLLKNTVENLPAILCQVVPPEQGAPFVEELFTPMPNAQGAEREFVTAALARLGCGILLQDRRGPQAEAVLGFIAQAARRLRNLTKDEANQARTWVLENLLAGAEPMDGKAHVTIEGARHLALAFEKAAQGFAAKDILHATARNLGLTPIGKKGESASYNPLQHEDVEGGMLPGDNAVMEEPGWALGQDIVVRARVKRGVNHV